MGRFALKIGKKTKKDKLGAVLIYFIERLILLVYPDSFEKRGRTNKVEKIKQKIIALLLF